MKKAIKNLYFLSQKENTQWETYDSAIVCAESKEQAVRMHPSKSGEFDENGNYDSSNSYNYNSWATNISRVKCKLIAENVKCKIGVIIASFNS